MAKKRNAQPRGMDEAEQAVDKWLRASFPGETPRFEPDGKYPPDFLLGDELAIEARRLNETRHDPATAKAIGLEQDSRRLWKVLDDTFAAMRSHDGRQYMVSLEITDPTQLVLDTAMKKRLAKDLAQAHAALLGKEETTEHPGFQLTWTPWKSEKNPEAVVLATSMHDNSGGFLEQVYADNMERLIAEKDHKAGKNARRPYARWWLVLVDHITPPTQYGHRFTCTVNKRRFERVVVIDRNSKLVLER